MINNKPVVQEKTSLLAKYIVIAMVALIGGFLGLYLSREPSKQPAPSVTPEAKAYVRNLKLSGVEMKATANYTGAAIVEIVGNIANGGDRTLKLVELNCVFYDNLGQVVYRERVPIVKRPLKPGENTAFRMPFEGLPDSWNKQMPQLVIANIVFE